MQTVQQKDGTCSKSTSGGSSGARQIWQSQAGCRNKFNITRPVAQCVAGLHFFNF
jgi:hypothetical protein